jgi:hypothetical protein
MLHCTKNRKYFARMKELDIDLSTAAKTLTVEQKELISSRNEAANGHVTEVVQTKFARV